MNGIYQEFGTLRQRALEMAIDTMQPEDTAEQIVAAAGVYYTFLVSGE